MSAYGEDDSNPKRFSDALNYTSEQQILLRVPEEIAATVDAWLSGKGDADVRYEIFQDGTGVLMVGSKAYRGKLCHLPTIVESLKTFDSSVFYKAGDIHQVFVVEGGEFPSLPQFVSQANELHRKAGADEYKLTPEVKQSFETDDGFGTLCVENGFNNFPADSGFRTLCSSHPLSSGITAPTRHIRYQHYQWEPSPESTAVREAEEWLRRVEGEWVEEVTYELVPAAEAHEALRKIRKAQRAATPGLLEGDEEEEEEEPEHVHMPVQQPVVQPRAPGPALTLKLRLGKPSSTAATSLSTSVGATQATPTPMAPTVQTPLHLMPAGMGAGTGMGTTGMGTTGMGTGADVNKPLLSMPLLGNAAQQPPFPISGTSTFPISGTGTFPVSSTGAAGGLPPLSFGFATPLAGDIEELGDSLGDIASSISAGMGLPPALPLASTSPGMGAELVDMGVIDASPAFGMGSVPAMQTETPVPAAIGAFTPNLAMAAPTPMHGDQGDVAPLGIADAMEALAPTPGVKSAASTSTAVPTAAAGPTASGTGTGAEGQATGEGFIPALDSIAPVSATAIDTKMRLPGVIEALPSIPGGMEPLPPVGGPLLPIPVAMEDPVVVQLREAVTAAEQKVAQAKVALDTAKNAIVRKRMEKDYENAQDKLNTALKALLDAQNSKVM